MARVKAYDSDYYNAIVDHPETYTSWTQRLIRKIIAAAPADREAIAKDFPEAVASVKAWEARNA